MNDLLKAFEGKKTYIIAALIALAVFAKQLGWIDQQTLDALYGILGAGGLAALRAGIDKGGSK